jgi:hypothetical protein
MASQIFLFNQQTYPDGDACFGAISTAKANGKAKYWGVLSPEYNKDGNVMVKCAHCGFLLSPSNVSRAAKSHFYDNYQTCVGAAATTRKAARSTAAAGKRQQPELAAADTVDMTGEGGNSSRQGPAAPSSNKRTKLEEFFVPPLVAVAAKEHLYKFFFRNPTLALCLIEDEELVASYNCMGIQLPGKKALSTTILDRVYEEVRDEVLSKMFGVLAQQAAGSNSSSSSSSSTREVICVNVADLPVLRQSFAVASDGWRKTAAAQGIPLININALADAGGAVFLQVRTDPSTILLVHCV